MNRRDLLASTGIIGAAGAMGIASSAMAGGHSHQHKSSHGVCEALANCIEKAEICSSHCIEMISEHPGLKDCLKATVDCSKICGVLLSIVNSGSPLVSSMAAVCIEACENCIAACSSHAAMHSACQECLEACEACIAACKELS